MSINWREALRVVNDSWVGSLLRSRADIMAKAGTTFGGEREHYRIFGWPLAPDFDTWEHLYERGGIAKRIVCSYPQATWRSAPEVKDASGKEESQFEAAWKQFCEKKRVYHYLERVDRMARMGQFSILFIGYSDARTYEDLAQPVGALPGADPLQKVLYLQPYKESVVDVGQWEDKIDSPRFGMPLLYKVRIQAPSTSGGSRGLDKQIEVHWTRVLHVAEDVLDNDLLGQPALKPVVNYLLDMEKCHGAAAEGFFQQTPPATVYNLPADMTMDATTYSDANMQEKIDDFTHGYKRWLITQGFDIKTIQPQISDMRQVVDPLLDLIAGTTGIPKRILIGSERGELASTQDETNWNKRIEERQQNWAEPFVLRPLIDELVAKGVLPVPQGGEYDVEWRENLALSEDAMAQIAECKTNAITKYAGTPGAEDIVPPDVFLSEVMGFSEETVERIAETRQELWDKELEDALKDEEELAEEERRKREILGELPEHQQQEGTGEPRGGGRPFAQAAAKKAAKGGKGKRFDESLHPRGRSGQFRDKAKVKKEGLSEKALRSLDSHVTATKEMQREAISNEKHLAGHIGAKHQKDNEPFDVIKGSHHIEVKTILVGKHDKITMRKECRLRKLDFLQSVGGKGHTVVFDNRNDKVYYSSGVGSFRLGGMEHLGSKSDYYHKLNSKLKD